jgi:hypothetical protein
MGGVNVFPARTDVIGGGLTVGWLGGGSWASRKSALATDVTSTATTATHARAMVVLQEVSIRY